MQHTQDIGQMMVVMTTHSLYYLHAGICVGVKNTDTRSPIEAHRAKGAKLFATQGIDGGFHRVESNLPAVGDRLCFDNDVLTSPVLKVFMQQVQVDPFGMHVPTMIEDDDDEMTQLSKPKTVLVVDDDHRVVRSVRRLLRAEGYLDFGVSSAMEAIEFCDDFDEDIDIVISDVLMPGMSGEELVNEVVARRAETKTVLMSAFPSDFLAEQGHLRPGLSILNKPLAPGALADALRQTLMH